LQDRVTFIDWFPSHNELLSSLSQYRGVVLPSIEDANGIVVQEAMGLGLPTVCLDWGGPQLLIQNNVSGFLVEPLSKNQILSDIAKCMDTLSSDGGIANRLSNAAKTQAENWRWSKIARSWLTIYSELR
jgi:glycosyltransferase involved in cell wall biosynthesis